MNEDEEFFVNLEHEVNERADREPGWLRRDAFVDVVGEYLIEDGALEDLQVCYYLSQRGKTRMEVGGYAISDDGRVLDLVAIDLPNYSQNVPRDQIRQRFRWARNFAEACRHGHHREMEESSPEYDMAQTINAHWNELGKIRIFLLTDGRSSLTNPESEELGGLPVIYELWDIERIRRLATSGRQEEPISLDLTKIGTPIPCLPAPGANGEHRTLLAVIPGRLLADLYERYGAKLLQRNVRAFLQARGKVNKGINETIRSTPELFLAYNNGISATATGVELADGPDGHHIIRLEDLQIVNGGQTTASLHHAVRRDKADLSRIQVPAKITVVEPEKLNDLVPRISRYANSQNTINEADFESNSPFHIQLERLSRSIWAPAPAGSTRQSHWYYERVRGQYDVAKSRFPTPATRRGFEQENPKSHRFTKTDAARYEMTFRQSPHVVSMGAQKCFQLWTVQVLAKADPPDEQEFRTLVARKIFFDRARKEIQSLFPRAGYLANVTAYTVARLVNDLDMGQILDRTWREQVLPEDALQAVRELCVLVREVLLDAPGSGNVTEWCKKEDCWKRVLDISWGVAAVE